jgi:hypothetical protein
VAETEVVSTTVGERVPAGAHLSATRADDLVLPDRGHPACWRFALHALEQRDFCMHLPPDSPQDEVDVVASGALNATVTFTPGAEEPRQCAANAAAPTASTSPMAPRG